MNREQLKALAQETLEISQAGRYAAEDQTVRIGRTQLYTAQDLERLEAERFQGIPQSGFDTVYTVRREGTVDTVLNMAGWERRVPVIGVLNFASAKNPGGGFLNGAMAQEESLAYCSDLYLIQTTGPGPRYYEINRACHDPVYTDTMLMGDVTFFRNSDFTLTHNPVTCKVLTAPAVNMGIVMRNGDSVERAKAVMKGRMRKVLALFAHWNCTRLVLGAYGCGVFRNDPEDVARFWQELLMEEGWGRYFLEINFSILAKSDEDRNIVPFRRLFG